MFRKISSVTSLGTYALVEGALSKVASSGPKTAFSSYLEDGSRVVDIREKLEKAADKFLISADPSDYLYEAIRANTSNVFNENHDGFHRNELLRYDARFRQPVYMSYVGKPHHVNHKTDDPLRARGLVIDAHYNDESPALADCPVCLTKTAEAGNRDPSGIHCKKCGFVVKDEFVETLVAVDTKKDGDLARGIRAGILDAVSMGCNCASTICNVCNHVAFSVPEFCDHIRSGSKGSLWQRVGSAKFKQIKPDVVRNMLREAKLGSKWLSTHEGNKLVSCSLVIPEKDFEVRKAAEYCQGTEFDELSRVHRPADPKAKTTELLKAASAPDAHLKLSIKEETDLLIVRARLQDNALSVKEAAVTKTASTNKISKFHVVRVNGKDNDIYVAASLAEAVKASEPGRRDKLDSLIIEACSLAEAKAAAMTSLIRTAQFKPVADVPAYADVTAIIPDGAKIHFDDDGVPGMGQPGMEQMPNGMMPGAPGQMPGAPMPGQPAPSMQDMMNQETQPDDKDQMSESEFGMLPPGAEGHDEGMSTDAEGDSEMKDNEDEGEDCGMSAKAEGDKEDSKEASTLFEDAYGHYAIEVFDKYAEVSDGDRPLFSVTATTELTTDADKYAFGRMVSDDLIGSGIVRTALKHKAAFHAKFADATEGAMFNMKEVPAPSQSAIDMRMTNMMEAPEASGEFSSTDGANENDNMAEDRPAPLESSVQDRMTNMEGTETATPSALSATEESDDNMREDRPQKGIEDDAVSDGSTNMKGNAGAAGKAKKAEIVDAKYEERVRKVYAARLDKIKAEAATEKEMLEKTLLDRVSRALKLAAKRHTLNLETSPLKAAMLDSLTVTRPVGRTASGEELEFARMNDDLALHLVEAAWHQSAEEEINTLVSRAAEIMTYGDQYLISAEKDLSKQAHAIPQVVASEQLMPVDEAQERAFRMRAELNQGNLNLAPGMAGSEEPMDKVASVRNALNGTKLGRFFEGHN